MAKVALSDITVGDRMRKDYGDLDSLKESLSTLGQIQPIVISQHGELIAGGRRFEAARSLGWKTIDVVVRQINDADDLREIELEENIQRKDMHWSERALTLYEIYKIRRTKQHRAGFSWTFRQAGELLGVTYSYINNVVRVCEAGIEDPEIFKELTFANAIQKMLKQEADRVAAHITKLHKERITRTFEDASDAVRHNEPQVYALPTHDDADESIENRLDKPASPKRTFEASELCICGDSIDYLNNHPLSIDHIFTDIPYGIDMMALNDLQDIDRTADEHDVQENIDLMERFIPAAALALKPKGWLAFFFDLDHFERLKNLARANGFEVQRWPIIMHKTSGGKSNAAHVNWTKDYECIFMARKPGALLTRAQSSSVIPISFTQRERRIFAHPFAKPRLVCKQVIEAISQPGETICDPFAGEGSIALSILASGRQPLAIEKMPMHHNLMLTHVVKALAGDDPVAHITNPSVLIGDITTII